jgi:N6-L-threonylcarbamoyladenine synthase
MAGGADTFPAIGLVVSGGHSNLYDCRGEGAFELIGSTLDDAAGEAFDKAAKILGLPYPGGPSIERAARTGNAAVVDFPRPLIADETLDVSFSGLKTALLYAAKGQPGSRILPPPLNPERVADLAASFQEAVVDVLAAKCRRALHLRGRTTLCVGGGVAANGQLRQRLLDLAAETGVRLVLAPPELCTDNAAMAGIAWEMLARGETAELDVDVVAGTVRLPR